MKQIKITKENFDYLASGVKTYELRAYEDLIKGKKVLFIDSITKTPLGYATLFISCVYDVNTKLFHKLNTTKKDTTIGGYSPLSKTAELPFWKPWVEHYLTKGETPAFYQVLALEVIK